MSASGRNFIRRRSGFSGRRRRTGFGKGFTTGGVGAKGGRTRGLVNITQQNRLAPMDNQIREATTRSIRDLINAALSHLQRITPSRTGALKTSYRKRFFQLAGRITTDKDYIKHVELGTKPHEILPRFASALRFEIGGRTIFAKRVQHPGTRPQRIVRRTVRFIKQKIPQVTKNRMRAVGSIRG